MEEAIPIISLRDVSVTERQFSKVLVLNQNYEPLSIAKVPRALSLISSNKAEVLSHGVAPIQTSSCALPRPSVIRLMNYIKRPRPHVRLTRREIFKRDNFTCQYCGKSPKELTIDHVMPVSRGGQDTWLNLVSSCKPCNKRKGARTPDEARMFLRHAPFEPHVTSYLHLLDTRPEWNVFLAH